MSNVIASEAEDALAFADQLALDRGEGVAPSRVTFRDVAADYFEMFESLVLAGDRSERSLVLYRQRWRSHLEPRLGALPIQKIKAQHVARLLEDLRRAGLSSWTLKGLYSILCAIFQHGQTRGLVGESPLLRLAKAERPKGRNQTQARTLSNEEVASLIDNTAANWRVFVATAAATGMRQSELLGLRWQDVDLGEEGLVHVRHQLSRATAKTPARLIPPKAGSLREIEVSGELVHLLREHKMASAFKGETDFVFATQTGGPLEQRNACRAMQKAGTRAGLNGLEVEPVGVHDLRHTAISRWIAAGLDLVAVQRLAGHKDATTTLRIYAHAWERAQRSQDIRAKMATAGLMLAGAGA